MAYFDTGVFRLTLALLRTDQRGTSIKYENFSEATVRVQEMALRISWETCGRL